MKRLLPLAVMILLTVSPACKKGLFEKKKCWICTTTTIADNHVTEHGDICDMTNSEKRDYEKDHSSSTQVTTCPER